MKTTLEYKDSPAKLMLNGVVLVQVTSTEVVPSGSLVKICAWCDPKKFMTRRLTKGGYHISHGICKVHKDEFLAKMNHMPAEKGKRRIVIATKGLENGLWGLWSNSDQCWMHKEFKTKRSAAVEHGRRLGFEVK